MRPESTSAIPPPLVCCVAVVAVVNATNTTAAYAKNKIPHKVSAKRIFDSTLLLHLSTLALLGCT